MYDQLWNSINSHLLVVWQSLGVLIGGFAILTLVEKQVISEDIATALIILLSGWLIANLYDAGYWYNRNLVIIANIEKDFLVREDLRNITYYFGKHRESNKMITHFRIQRYFAAGVAIIVTFYHLISRVLPIAKTGIILSNANQLQIWWPYVALISMLYLIWRVRADRNRRYSEILNKSPGKDLSRLPDSSNGL
jgi:hypothetical protein